MTNFPRAAAAALLLASLLASGPGRTADAPTCFWGRPTDPDVVNVFYPDKGATYWGARPVVVAPGEQIVLHGLYPHARYMSFNVYDEQLAPVDALADVEIVPDPGSTNPFSGGAARDGAVRAYTVRVAAGPAPATRAPNTIYLSAAGAGSSVGSWLLYRVYVPDEGRDATGGGGLPSATTSLPDGSSVNLTARCNPADANRPLGSELGGVPVQEAMTDGDAPGSPATFPSSDPLHWEKFFNLAHAQTAYATNGTAARGVADAAFGREMGGYLSNAHNAYVFATASRGFGDVLVLRMRAPATPRTRAGAAVMQDGELRYWSVCTNERNSTRWIDCVVDEDAPRDAGGFVTIVVSSPASRPANATLACGATWLAWGTSPETFLILRHMLPAAGFAHAIQRVLGPGDVETVMGEFLPAARYTTRAAYESLGC